MSKPWIDPKPEIRTLKKWEAAWLAGVIDSDGSIGYYNYGREGCRTQVQVSNVCYSFLEKIKETIGCGSNVNHIPSVSHKGRQAMFLYCLKGSARCYWLLRQIIPFLIVKRRKAQDIIMMLESKPFGRWVARTPESRAEQSRRATLGWADPATRERRLRGMRNHYAKRKR